MKKISVTFLTAYLYCKRKFFLEQVAGITEPPKEVLVKGKIKHDVFDLVNKQERGIVLSINDDDKPGILRKYRDAYARNLKNILIISKKSLQQINTKLIDAYQDLWLFFEEESAARAENVYNFLKTRKVFGKELWDSLLPKIESEVYVESDTLQLKGKIDRIENFNETIVPVELKTGSAPKEGVWESHLIQIVAYMMLLEEKLGKPTAVGKVRYFKNNIEREVHINPFLREEVKKLVKEVQDFLEKQNLPDFTKNKTKCVSCGLKEDCFRFQT
jgi:CRISPR-associated exonuclease Cas4